MGNKKTLAQIFERQTHFSHHRFHDRRFRIDRGDPPFPRPSGPWWFGCPQADGSDNQVAFANKDQVDAVSLFVEEGEETLLDVAAGDEDYSS